MKRKTIKRPVTILERPRYIVGMVRNGQLQMFQRFAITLERAEEIATEAASKHDDEFIVFRAVSSHKRAAPPINKTLFRSR